MEPLQINRRLEVEPSLAVIYLVPHAHHPGPHHLNPSHLVQETWVVILYENWTGQPFEPFPPRNKEPVVAVAQIAKPHHYRHAQRRAAATDTPFVDPLYLVSPWIPIGISPRRIACFPIGLWVLSGPVVSDDAHDGKVTGTSRTGRRMPTGERSVRGVQRPAKRDSRVVGVVL